MDIQLVQLFVLVCTVYDTRGKTCFQRLSNNSDTGKITDQELITIYWFGHLQGHFEKKAIHRYVQAHWLHYFPKLPAYQTFVARLNQLEASFQTLGAYLQEQLPAVPAPEVDQLLDSLPVMLRARRARVHGEGGARDRRCRLLREQETIFSWRAAAHCGAAAGGQVALSATDLGARRLVPRCAQCQRAGTCLAHDDLNRRYGVCR